jgi:hypothetical protein
MSGGGSGGATGCQKDRQRHGGNQATTVTSVSRLHLTCFNPTLDHRGFRRGRHSRHLLIAVCASSITAKQGQRPPLLPSKVPRSAEERETGGRTDGEDAVIAVPTTVVGFIAATHSTRTRHPGLHPRKCVESPPSGDRSCSAVVWASASVVPPHAEMHPALIPPASICLRLSEVNCDHYKDVVVASAQRTIRAGQTTHQRVLVSRGRRGTADASSCRALGSEVTRSAEPL